MEKSKEEARGSSLESLMEEALSYLQERESELQRVVSSGTELKASGQSLMERIEASYERKTDQIQSQSSNAEESLENLRSLLEEHVRKSAALEESQSALESLLSRLQEDIQEKRAEGCRLVQDKRLDSSASPETDSLFYLYKIRSYLYSITNLAWHNKKLKCYFIAPQDTRLQLFNFEGLKKQERESLWESLESGIHPEWKAC